MAKNYCETLLEGCITANCSDPIFQGVKATAYIFNKSEIASFTYDQTNPNLITAINMKTHEVGSEDVAYTGYKVSQFGKTPFTGTTTTMVEGTIVNKFDDEVHFTVYDNSPSAAKLIDQLKDGRFVMVLGNEYEGMDGQGGWQVFGAKRGMTASEITGEKYNDDTEGGWAVTLKEEGATNSALFLEHKTSTDVDTEEYLESLVSCE